MINLSVFWSSHDKSTQHVKHYPNVSNIGLSNKGMLYIQCIWTTPTNIYKSAVAMSYLLRTDTLADRLAHWESYQKNKYGGT